MSRRPEEIQASIESNRQELVRAVDSLRGQLTLATDWRRQFELHREQAVIGATAAGFIIGGGIAALGGALFKRRRRR